MNDLPSILGSSSVHLGAGVSHQLPIWLNSFGYQRILLICGGNFLKQSGHLDRMIQELLYSSIKCQIRNISCEPNCAHVDELAQEIHVHQIQAIVAIGGGSVLDTAKAVAAMATVQGSVSHYLEGVGTLIHPGTSLPWIAVPTTAGTGSESTNNAVIKGIDRQGLPYKKSLRHPAFLPTAIFLDSIYTVDSPLPLSFACAMDAFSQLLEAYTSMRSTSRTDMACKRGLELMTHALPLLAQGEDSHTVRLELAEAACLSGYGISHSGLGLVHGVAGIMGAMHPIPHSIVCATLVGSSLKHTLKWLNDHPSPQTVLMSEKYNLVGAMLNPQGTAEHLLQQLQHWTHDWNIPRLSQYGFTAQELLDVSERASNRDSAAKLNIDEIHQFLSDRA